MTEDPDDWPEMGDICIDPPEFFPAQRPNVEAHLVRPGQWEEILQLAEPDEIGWALHAHGQAAPPGLCEVLSAPDLVRFQAAWRGDVPAPIDFSSDELMMTLNGCLTNRLSAQVQELCTRTRCRELLLADREGDLLCPAYSPSWPCLLQYSEWVWGCFQDLKLWVFEAKGGTVAFYRVDENHAFWLVNDVHLPVGALRFHLDQKIEVLREELGVVALARTSLQRPGLFRSHLGPSRPNAHELS